MRIGEVAKRSGFTASSIRYYESMGVLPEPERVGGQRHYDPEVLSQLAAVGVAQRAGFSLEEIQLLLRAAATGSASEKLQELAGRKLGDVETLIAQAEAMKTWLLGAQACECASLDICALFNRELLEAAPADS